MFLFARSPLFRHNGLLSVGRTDSPFPWKLSDPWKLSEKGVRTNAVRRDEPVIGQSTPPANRYTTRRRSTSRMLNVNTSADQVSLKCPRSLPEWSSRQPYQGKCRLRLSGKTSVVEQIGETVLSGAFLSPDSKVRCVLRCRTEIPTKASVSATAEKASTSAVGIVAAKSSPVFRHPVNKAVSQDSPQGSQQWRLRRGKYRPESTMNPVQ